MNSLSKYFLLLLFAIGAVDLRSQSNLVNNPGFDILTGTLCPQGINQLTLSAGWYPTCGTPDYFNVCSPSNVSVPHNMAGSQSAYSGNAYAGFIPLSTATGGGFSDWREYISTQLNQTMIPGKRYYLSMKVSLGEVWQDFDTTSGWNRVANTTTATEHSRRMPCNNLGMKFTKSQLTYTNSSGALLNNFAHLYTPNIISDTTNWTTIQGSFVADSAYTHVVIGNFFTNANTDTIGNIYASYSYYYLDNVIVSTDSTVIDYTLSVKENSLFESSFKIFPNPSNGNFTLSFSSERDTNIKFFVTDITGRVLVERRLSVQYGINQVNLKFDNIPAGIYFISSARDNNKEVVKKIIIE